MMRHLDDKTALRVAMNEAADEERNLVRAHIDECERCRGRFEETARVWGRLDAAEILPDAPLWPGVVARLDEARGAQGKIATLRPVWKLALAESARSPFAYAALLVLALGIGGGHVAGRALLGGDLAATTTTTAATAEAEADAELLDYTALVGLPDASLASTYFGDDLYENDGGTGEEATR